MKSRFFFFGLLILIPLLSAISLVSCNSIENKCTWVDSSIKIDGVRSEWDKVPFNYFEDEDVVLGSCNDSAYLYLIFSFKNVSWAQAISRSGLTIWLDRTGKKKKETGLLYLGGPSPEELRATMQDKFGFENRPGMEDRPDSLRRQSQDKFARITGGDKQVEIATDGSQGPAVGFSTVNEIYTYEFAIPLDSPTLGIFGIGAAPGQLVSIGAEWGGMDKNMQGNRPQRGDRSDRPDGGGGGFPGGGGGMPGGGGGMPGGGGPGGGGPGGGRSETMERQEIWLKTQLADIQVSDDSEEINK